MIEVWQCSYCGNLNPYIEPGCPECGLPRPTKSYKLVHTIKAHWKTFSTIGIVSLMAIVVIFSCAFLGFFNSTGQTTDADGKKSAVLLMVKNWTPPQNEGMSCEQAYDALVNVYQKSLGINDAAVTWSVDDPVGKYYTVHASLKGETGWIDYRWKVNPKTNTITAMDGMSICPYSP
jgi:hypothetical protein